jgi:kinesin family protein 18/19
LYRCLTTEYNDRVRPESTREKGLEGRRGPIIRTIDNNMLVFDPSDNIDVSSPHKRRALGVRRGKDLRFAFDRVFDENCTQMDIYTNTGRVLLNGVLDGYNATVFAYGATGAGKTYTMMGNDSSGPGVMVLTVIDLFNMMEKNSHEKSYKVTITFLEVYNEQIRDLLADPTAKPIPLDVREDKIKGIVVSGLSEHNPTNPDEVLELVRQGTANRTQHGTAANQQSSRSHAVFQIIVEQKDRTASIQTDVKIGKLSLIDLAGSERASVTKNRGARLVEGANINKSLLALANCINALGKNKGKGYVPYRNSKLTRLLKDSLGGNCRTVMIANVSPNSCCYDDTFNTLKYANRAKNIKTTAVKNVHNVNFHISKYTKLIDELRAEVSELKKKVAIKKDTMMSQPMMELEREKTEMYNIRAALGRLYHDQMKDRRTLMEIEETDRQNALKVMSIRNEIKRWEREHPNCGFESMPLRLHTIHKDAESLLDCTKQFAGQKDRIRDSLQSNIVQTKSLQEKALLSLKNEELRQIVDLQSRINDIEILNLDLERMAQHHRARELRMKLIAEESQYATNKLTDTIHLLAEKLRQLNGLSPDTQHMCSSALQYAEFLTESIGEALNEQDDEDNKPSPHSPISKLSSSAVVDALKTPTHIVSGARKRKLRYDGSPQKNPSTHLAFSSSPMATSPSPTKQKKKLRVDNSPMKAIPMFSLNFDSIPDHVQSQEVTSNNSRMDMSDDDIRIEEEEEDEILTDMRSIEPFSLSPRTSVDPLVAKFAQLVEDANNITSGSNIQKKNRKLNIKQRIANRNIAEKREAWGEQRAAMRAPRQFLLSDGLKKTTKKVKFIDQDQSGTQQQVSTPREPLLRQDSANKLPSYMQSTASTNNRVSNTIRTRSSPPAATNSSTDINSMWIGNLRNNKENAHASSFSFPTTRKASSKKNGNANVRPMTART